MGPEATLQSAEREMEPLFLAVICGCNAGLCRDALHAVYLPRNQRGNAVFAANVLGATETLLSVIAHFFEHGRWGSPIETAVEGQSLTADDLWLEQPFSAAGPAALQVKQLKASRGSRMG